MNYGDVAWIVVRYKKGTSSYNDFSFQSI